MRLRACEREAELLALLRSGAWAAAGAEMQSHAADCASCGEVLRVKKAMMSSRTDGIAVACVEASGVIWWRAQVRKRYLAQRQVEQPVRRAQFFSLLVAVAAGVGLLVANGSGWVDRLRQAPETGLEWSSAWSGPGWALAAAVGALALLGGVVLYLAADRD